MKNIRLKILRAVGFFLLAFAVYAFIMHLIKSNDKRYEMEMNYLFPGTIAFIFGLYFVFRRRIYLKFETTTEEAAD